MSIKVVLHTNLKRIREEKGITQEELSKRLNLSRMTISAIETERFVPSAGIAAQLCFALNVKFEDMFYLDVEEDNK